MSQRRLLLLGAMSVLFACESTSDGGSMDTDPRPAVEMNDGDAARPDVDTLPADESTDMGFADADGGRTQHGDDLSGDGEWPTDTPQALGFDDIFFETAMERVESLKNIRSVLVVRHGVVVAEDYYQGTSADDLQHVRSISKSVGSLLLGIAIDEGFVESAEVRLTELFPELETEDEPTKADIRLTHVLAHTSGFAWNEGAEIAYDWFFSPIEPFAFILDRPMADTPGKVFNYDSPATHLLSLIIARTTGMSTVEYARQKLFNPLGIDVFEWQEDSLGNVRTDTGLELRTRDMAKIAQLVLQAGRWQGRQIVSEAWLRESMRLHYDFGEGNGYGFLWWIDRVLGFDMQTALGWGGQNIVTVPAIDAAFIVTQEWMVSSDESLQQIGWFANYVLPQFLMSAAFGAAESESP